MKISNKSLPLYRIINLHKLRFTVPGILLLLLSITFYSPAFAQQKNEQPHWWFGVAGGANFNSYNGSTSSLNRDVTVSPAFNKGHGVGGYGAVVIEYHRPGAIWGAMLQQGIDNRRGNFKQAGKEFDAKISYYTVEPSFILMPPKTHIYAYVGPRLGFLWNTKFTYQQPNSPEYPNKADPEAHAYIRSLKKNPVSMQVGIGYNLMIPSGNSMNQFIISPFVTYIPSLGINIRTIESLKLNTLRAGIALKAGCASKTE